MKSVRIAVVAGIAGVVAMAEAALAADPPPAPRVATPAAVPFDWAGPYLGAVGGVGVAFRDAGVQAGYNVVRGRLVAGIEARVAVGSIGGMPLFGVPVSGRAGVVFGARDRILLYGTGGVGVKGLFWNAGGGVGWGVRDRWSLFGEANIFGIAGLGCCGASFQFGINRHP